MSGEQQMEIQGKTGTGAPTQRARVLVVDDEPTILELIEVLLEDLYDVTCVNGGFAAIETLESDPAFDSILCDMTMPEVDGVALHRFLMENLPDLAGKLRFLSGGVHGDRAEQHLRDHPTPIVTKPFTTEALDAAVRSAL